MPRLGRHPMKKGDGLNTPKSKKLSITTIVHIPETTGYWENCLNVLDLCISSIYAHTPVEFDLYVFDNGSCSEVKEYLHDHQKNGQIQFLTFSKENVRKTGGLNFLLNQADGEYVAYLDSDAFVLPGWYEKSLEIIEEYDNVGQVTAIPLARNKSISDQELKALKENSEITISKGKDLIPEMYVKAHAESVGKDYDEYVYNRLNDREDVKLTKNKISAILGSVDFQFITSNSVINDVIRKKLSDISELRGDDIYIPIWEKRLRDADYKMFSTEDYLVHHMGNKIPCFEKELPWIDLNTLNVLPTRTTHSQIKSNRKGRFLQSTRLRRLIKKIHLWTYRFLYER
mgnify:CR=1 FL=1|jgi:glycosyltransferase involved in cell wall biosynthesis